MKVSSSGSEGAQSRAVASPHIKDSAEVVHLVGMVAFGGFSGRSHWEEALWQNQNSLEGLYIPSDLGTPRDPPGGAGECCWVEGCLGLPAEPVGSTI